MRSSPPVVVTLLLLASLSASSCAASEGEGPNGRIGVTCDIAPFSDASRVARCGYREPDGTVRVLREALEGVEFPPVGVATIRVGGEFYFVTRQGKAAPALPFDNGADYFVEGLARTVRGGKVGFVDSRLREVIAAEWDFAFPFEGGRARVCRGCVVEPARPGEEHREVIGGRWGFIDKAGRVVVLVVHERDSVPDPQR